jgi:hypothetical protein
MIDFKKEFRYNADALIRKVCRHQRMLINTGKSDLNIAAATLIIENLERHLNQVNFTEDAMINYFLNEKENIEYLITSPEKQDTYSELLESAQKLNAV